MWEFLSKGGYLIYPLLFCSVMALAVILERAVSFSRIHINPQIFMERIKEYFHRGRIIEALEFCDRHPVPLARVIKAGLLKHDRPPEHIQEAMELQLQEEVPVLEKYLGILATISAVSPLLGLLGTVSGMIKIFARIESAGGFIDPVRISGGIWEALLTTALGLMIAIPSIVAYNYFSSRVRIMTLEIETASRELKEVITSSESYEV